MIKSSEDLEADDLSLSLSSSSSEIMQIIMNNNNISNSVVQSSSSTELNAKDKKYIDGIKVSIEYFLNLHADPGEILFDDQEISYDHLNQILNITKHVIKKHKQILNASIFNLLSESRLVGKFVELIEFGFHYVKEAVSTLLAHSPSYRAAASAQESTNKNDDSTAAAAADGGDYFNSNKIDETMEKNLAVFYFLNVLIQLIWCLTNFSKIFRQTFHQENGSRVLLTYLGDKRFIGDYIMFEQHVDSSLNEALGNLTLIKALIGSLHNLSKSVNFQDLNGTAILIDFAHRMKAKNEYVMPVYMTLANILTDKEIEELPDTLVIIEKLVQIISYGAGLISNEIEGLRRVKIELENGAMENVCILTDDDDVQWDITELLSGLYRIAVNDKIKYYIYNECNLREQINKIIVYGNMTEKEYSIKLLHQLSFDVSVAFMMNEDKSLITTIQKLIENESYFGSDTGLIKFCKGLIWTIESKVKPEIILADDQNNSNSNQNNENDIQNDETTSLSLNKMRRLTITTSNELDSHHGHGHRLKSDSLDSLAAQQPLKSSSNGKQIMISYNSFSRELCLKIKKVLENLGYKIWIDIESMFGCSLEAMAGAIEKSDLILICMTQKYKLSPNCRAEAEYAFNLRKKYIPLIMEKNYKPDGWLGLILGAKIFIDFSKYVFEDAMEKLRHELRQYLNETSAAAAALRPPPVHRAIEKPQAGSGGILVESSSIQIQREKAKSTSETRGERILDSKNASTENLALPPISSWSRVKVRDWLIECEMSESLIDCLGGEFDGEMLNELNYMRLHAPEFFYKTISTSSEKSPISLSQLVKFSKELRKLFN